MRHCQHSTPKGKISLESLRKIQRHLKQGNCESNLTKMGLILEVKTHNWHETNQTKGVNSRTTFSVQGNKRKKQRRNITGSYTENHPKLRICEVLPFSAVSSEDVIFKLPSFGKANWRFFIPGKHFLTKGSKSLGLRDQANRLRRSLSLRKNSRGNTTRAFSM